MISSIQQSIQILIRIHTAIYIIIYWRFFMECKGLRRVVRLWWFTCKTIIFVIIFCCLSVIVVVNQLKSSRIIPFSCPLYSLITNPSYNKHQNCRRRYRNDNNQNFYTVILFLLLVIICIFLDIYVFDWLSYFWMLCWTFI